MFDPECSLTQGSPYPRGFSGEVIGPLWVVLDQANRSIQAVRFTDRRLTDLIV